MRLLLVLSLAMVLWSLSLPPVAAKRVRVKTAIIPKGPKKPSLVTGSAASDLPYPLGQLWVYLAQGDMPHLLCRNWKIMGVVSVAFIILRICRIVREPQSQASSQEQSHRKRQVQDHQVCASPLPATAPARVLPKEGSRKISEEQDLPQIPWSQLQLEPVFGHWQQERQRNRRDIPSLHDSSMDSHQQLLYWRAQNWTQPSGVASSKQRGRITSLNMPATLP
ncbi:uncharacterized protein LOC116790645 [Chiroxiphia lanceolata]|uniref:uncharacterized protein LOC116790645 n=1 Tax=Chiroxiphia lanceolata TaxID=296741 RepID=UPI0013CEAAC6|nr:uncharacterized protein LOC116790645 [Chiroxiphia lanceolata]